MIASGEFRVVTHKAWLANQFAEALPEVTVTLDHGFDIDPSAAAGTLWWAPGAWTARARRAGVRLSVTSCGPRWLESLPWPYRRRAVHTLTVGELAALTPADRLSGPWFLKLPEAKLESFSAAPRQIGPDLGDELRAASLREDTLIEVQGVVDLDCEARFWIARNTITACSLYRAGSTEWGGPEWDPPRMRHGRQRELSAMATFAEELLADPAVQRPPGFTLDLAIDTTGRPLVVEANAAWSSGVYDGDTRGIYQAIMAAHDFTAAHQRWGWNPYLDIHRGAALRTPGA